MRWDLMTWGERLVWGLALAAVTAFCVGIGLGGDWLRIRVACALGWIICK